MFDLIENPEQLPSLFTRYWNERNADGIASLFPSEAEFINVVGLWWHTREDIRKAHDYGLKVIFNHSRLSLIRSKVKYLSDDIAIVHAKMKLEGQTAIEDTKSPAVRRNIFTFVVKKTGDHWLCEAAHNTDIVPGKETNMIDEKGRIRAVDYRRPRG